MRIYKSVKVNDLRAYDANSRTHSKEQIEQVKRSIIEFGFTNPLLIDENNTIIAGHARLAAANELGHDSVPAIVLDGLSESQKRAYVIADNKLALNAGWDMGILAAEFELLKLDDYDVSLTGFSDDEIDAFDVELIPELLGDEDDCPDIPDEPITKLGDVWQLGEHRLMCGDSTVQTDVDKLLRDAKPNLMVTDPPYGVKLDMSWRNKAKKETTNNSNVILNDDRASWYDSYVLFGGDVAYVWHASMFTDVIMTDLRAAGFEIKQQIIWVKEHFTLRRSDYHWQHEPCWYAVRKGAKHSWEGDRKQTTTWNAPSPNQPQSKKLGDNTEHPTQKPVTLYTKAILNHTKRGDDVYDPFAGSGTLMAAGEKTKRRALMMELDPKYCDVIIKRYENLTGNKAVRDDNG